ncbi:MAG: hypothetical protein J1F22_05000 [Lachnospiraceae bacterium]|nr:hypothetical protein [Lachnospiraceae bacterium]
MKGNRKRKYIGLTLGLTAICTVGFLAVSVTNVFGQFIPKAPYVADEPDGYSSSIQVTDEGGNRKGDYGTGKTPMDGIPKAEGQKGTKDNPFVLLEIVPELAQQQMIYMNLKEDEKKPLDVMQIGIDACNDGRNFINPQDISNYGLHNSIGEWFCHYTYNVYKFGDDEKTEAKPLVEIGQIYSLQFSDSDIKAAGGDPEKFKNIYNNGNGTVADLAKEVPALFANDTSKSKKEIRDIAIADNRNWKKSSSNSHEIEISADGIAESDKNLSISEMVKKYPDAFETDKAGNILDKAGNVVTEEELRDSATWSAPEEKTLWGGYTLELSELDVKEPIAEDAKIAKLAEKYPKLFKRDKDGNTITQAAINDQNNWTIKTSSGTVKKTSGYMVNVGVGKGDFYAREVGITDSFGWAKFVDDPGKNQWIYCETLPDGAFPISEKDDSARSNPWQNPKDYSDEKLVNGYFDCADFTSGCEISCDTYVLKYNKSLKFYVYKCNKTNYDFSYYGLKTNDVLKRMLFTFQSEEECDNFNMKVIAMTPSEINEAVKNDTENTLDIIERADMFYVGSYDKNTDGIKNIYEMYHKFVSKDKNYTFSPDDMKSYYENDLDWISCYKILYRLCMKENLPLMLTQGLGKMVNNGVDGTNNTHMYVTEDKTANHLHAKGTLSNMAKIYLLTVQFDMLAKKSGPDDPYYKRTFYNDILPKLQTIALNADAMKGADKNTASTTGYYERMLVQDNGCSTLGDASLLTEEEKQKEKETCYYLWNLWTFYPSDIKLSDGHQVIADVDTYLRYGYVESFFDSNADVFNDGVADHHSGSDGYDGKNVGIVHGDSNSDTNHSTLLGSTESDGILNRAMDTAYQIMNKQTPTVDALTVKVEEQKKDYQKLSDELILVDYDKNADYGNPDKKTLYVKLTISNPNNEDGILQSLELVEDEDDSDGIVLTPRKKKKDQSTALSKENIKDINNQNPVNGYRVPANGTLTFYVPYQRSDWMEDKSMIRLVLQGRKYITKKSSLVSSLGGKTKRLVEISERTLFNLE